MISRLDQTPDGGVGLVGDSPVYTGDKIVDALVETVLELSAQIWVSRDRQYVVEDLLAQGLTPTVEAIDAYQPAEARKQYLAEERKQFVDDIMQHLRSVTRGE